MKILTTKMFGFRVFSVGVTAGTLVLSSSQTEDKDNLWIVDSAIFPFQSSLMESFVSQPMQSVKPHPLMNTLRRESVRCTKIFGVANLIPLSMSLLIVIVGSKFIILLTALIFSCLGFVIVGFHCTL